MSLSIQRFDDFVEAHKVTDQGQILAIARLIQLLRCGNVSLLVQMNSLIKA
ncbi:hypothetical protein [Mesorhizobium prunaredense]|uniref:hypothetical protein n=1 Tax=Mesorhizobium prunaredense TaxID=1631249 RepID=UPI00142D73FA|nr:hypothetical protein [Mesorhizobium prunaredense]